MALLPLISGIVLALLSLAEDVLVESTYTVFLVIVCVGFIIWRLSRKTSEMLTVRVIDSAFLKVPKGYSPVNSMSYG